MKLFRFMSKEEFEKLIKGEELKNTKKHDAKTTSVGFCFMKDDEPEYAYEYLSGIVSDDVCVVFETKKKLNKSYGVYADPYGSFFSTITKDEYCTTSYSLKDFKIVKMAIIDWREEKWKWETDEKKILFKLKREKAKEEKIEEKRKNIIKLEKEIESKKAMEFQEFFNEFRTINDCKIIIKDKYLNAKGYVDQVEYNPSDFGCDIVISYKVFLHK